MEGCDEGLGRIATCALVACLVVSCGSSVEPVAEPKPKVVYVGQVDGTDARIGLVRNDAQWAAYVCGGPTTLESMTAWFEGEGAPPSDAGVEAQSNGKLLRVTFSGQEATGSVLADREVPFSAPRVPDDHMAGLYQMRELGCRSGLVVPPPGAGDPQGVHCESLDASGNVIPTVYQQVNPLSPLEVTDRGIPSRVVGEQRTIYLTAVVLPLP